MGIKIVLLYLILCIIWFDKSGFGEWFLKTFHIDKRCKELHGEICLDKQFEAYKSLCWLFSILFLLGEKYKILLILASISFMAMYIRWILNTDKIPFFSIKTKEGNFRAPLIGITFPLILAFICQYNRASKISIEFVIAVSGFGILFLIIYLIFAAPQERNSFSNGIICLFLFSLLGFGVISTINDWVNPKLVEEKNVMVKDIKFSSQISSFTMSQATIYIKEEDAYAGITSLFIPSSEARKLKAGQTIVIKEMQGMVGMKWILYERQ